MTDSGRDAIIAVADPATTTRARGTDDRIDAVLELVASGVSVRGACVAEGVDRATFYRHVLGADEVRKRYELALAARAEVYAEEIAEIADANPKTVPVYDAEGTLIEVKIDTVFEAWRKTRIDARTWTASRLLPKRYGDRNEVDAKMQVVPALDLALSGPTPRIIDVEAPDDGATDTGGAHPSRALRSEGA